MFQIAYGFLVTVLVVLLGVYFSLRVNEAKMYMQPAKKIADKNPKTRQLGDITEKRSSEVKVSDRKISEQKDKDHFLMDDQETIEEVMGGRYDSFLQDSIDEMNFRKKQGFLDEKLQAVRSSISTMASRNQMKIMKAEKMEGQALNLDEYAQPIFN